jgi:hypothetical protein
LASGLFAVVEIAVERQAGHVDGSFVGSLDEERAAKSLPELKELTGPS